jgi:two-component system C4-dicarboxylate transport sensor histidine kinase DctB
MRGWRVTVQIVVLAFVLGFFIWPRLERYFLLQAAQQNAVTQRLATDGLQAALDRYAPLPPLIAERPDLVELLRNPDDAELLAQGNAELSKVAEEVAASDVYLMDLTGDAIIASNYLLQTSFVGENFDYRPYFFNALDKGWGEFFARGTTSGLRGYFYGAPVSDGDERLGVLALKFGVGCAAGA